MKAVNLSHELHYHIPRLILAIQEDLITRLLPVSLTTEQNMIVLEGICQRVVQSQPQAVRAEEEAALVWARQSHPQPFIEKYPLLLFGILNSYPHTTRKPR